MNDDLYQRAIVDLARDASRAGTLDPAGASVTRDNPLCGDRVTMTASLAADGTVAEIRHRTRGCLLCEAAAALVAANAGALDRDRAQAAQAGMRAYLRGEAAQPPWPGAEAFAPVRSRKSRHDCVTLAFDALAGLFDARS